MFCVASAFLGFAAGTALGAQFLVPPGQGLAGPAGAMAWGLGAGLMTALAAAFTGARIRVRSLVRLTILAVLTAGLVIAWGLWRMQVMAAAQPDPPPAPVTSPLYPLTVPHSAPPAPVHS